MPRAWHAWHASITVQFTASLDDSGFLRMFEPGHKMRDLTVLAQWMAGRRGQ
jgi:hypothetical protein